jgi:threonine dehydrogenase-like Zn-dependent dehydrogenase
VQAVATAGTMGVIGVCSPEFDSYPIGQAMNKNLILKMGNCNHHRYVPELLDPVAAGLVDPAAFITQEENRPQLSRPTRRSSAVRRAGLRLSSISTDNCLFGSCK